jgi:hypothetical protein
VLGVLLDLLVELVGDLLLPIILEFLWGATSEAIDDALDRPRQYHPAVAFLGYAVLGGHSGLVSVAVFRHALFAEPRLRIANLAIAPLLSGSAMAIWAVMRRRRDADPPGIATFLNGAVFAFAFAAVRLFLVS